MIIFVHSKKAADRPLVVDPNHQITTSFPLDVDSCVKGFYFPHDS